MWQTSGIRNCRQVKNKAYNLKTETQMRKGRLSPKYCSDQSKENMRFFSSHFSEILAGHWAGCLVAWFKLFKYFCCISIVFPMYFQFISIVFPLYIHCISIIFPLYINNFSVVQHNSSGYYGLPDKLWNWSNRSIWSKHGTTEKTRMSAKDSW